MPPTNEQVVKETLELCLSLSDDPKYQEEIKNASHEERVQMLLDNGFTYEEE